MRVRAPYRILQQTRNYPLCSTFNPPHSHHSLSPPTSTTIKMEASPSTSSKRPTCPTCSKPARFCLCNRILNPGGLDNKVSVTILQHSLEQKHPLNSAKIAKLGLRNVALHTVSDVNFDARFVIRVLEPGLEVGAGWNGSGRRGFGGCLEMEKTQKRKFENLADFEFSGFFQCLKDSNFGENLTNCRLDFDDENNVDVLQGNEESAVIVSIGKYGVISGVHGILLPQNDERMDFDRFLGSRVGINALTNGFVVKKLQNKRLNGNMELEELEEFKIEVPSGTVLLFPSDTAVGVDDLKAMNIKVKNLIVLDGTWAKARRMYKENPWLRVLPHLKLDSEEWSLYSEVRRQPRAGCLSSIESIVYALKALGDSPEGLDNLLDVFESMVADQRRCKDERLSKVFLG